MISFFIKSFFWLCFSFLIFSIPIKNQPVFEHISAIFGPTTQGFLGDFEKRATETFDVGASALNKLFKTMPEVSDKLELTQSSSSKEELPMEDYTREERELLKTILEKK